MKTNSSRFIALAAFAACLAIPLSAETKGSADLPIRRVVLFSSGVGYFEHAGSVEGNAVATLPFKLEEINDALKSLIVIDPKSSSPSVTYPSEDTLLRTLQSLRVDLSGAGDIASILGSLRGAEVTVFAPEAVNGRILGVEARSVGPEGETALFLSLMTKEGIRSLAMSEISTYAFADARIAEDLNRALDLLLASSSRDGQRRDLQVNLPGSGSRPVSIGYVIASPVWKVSYRLDLSGKTPYLQGWAIVDNASDIDWNGVRLSLVTGRPVSFVQNLYNPLYLNRPVLPLSIAGIAEARTYASGFGESKAARGAMPAAPAKAKRMEAREEAYEAEAAYDYAASEPAPVALGYTDMQLNATTVVTTDASAAGDQFEFTVKTPVTLERRRSAMLPLVEAGIKAERVSVYSGARRDAHPMLCASIVNDSGMKLPAGPITVFDGGVYAGDALIEFFPQGEKRIVAFGEDISVNGMSEAKGSSEIAGATVAAGVLKISRRNTAERVYTFKNASDRARKIVIEHPITRGSELAEPATFDEKTESLYRFSLDVPAGAERTLTVRERTIVGESIVLTDQNPDVIAFYAGSAQVPEKVRAALAKGIEFKKVADEAARVLAEFQAKRAERGSEQDRVRRNLDSVGRDTQQGKEYLRRMIAIDAEMDELAGKIDEAKKRVVDTKKAYVEYLSKMTI
ncbi:MAG TPA: hypothetical protein PLU93_01815 [Treponemataceae bacterium]|nr:hypothetical protein [Treponemataceae bacterium]